jgi:hypothetical protein
VLDAVGVGAGAVYPMDGRSLLQPGGRRRILLEHWTEGQPIPQWAALRTSRFQYVEYYDEDGLTPTFREYYDARDRWQLRNLVGDRFAGNDPARIGWIARRLDLDRRCRGLTCP